MAKSLGGFSHRELQGVKSHVTLPGGGGVGEQAAAMHSGTPAAGDGVGGGSRPIAKPAESSDAKSYRMANEARQADAQDDDARIARHEVGEQMYDKNLSQSEGATTPYHEGALENAENNLHEVTTPTSTETAPMPMAPATDRQKQF